MKRAWQECIHDLEYTQRRVKFEIISFVLMNNHYHLIIKINSNNLLKFQTLFKPLNLDHIKTELIKSKKYLFHAYRYCYQNPLRAGLSKRIQDYPYSLAYYLSKGSHFKFPIIDKFGIIDEYKLYWLNHS
jgi:REP element-mobilizing transposase RayT